MSRNASTGSVKNRPSPLSTKSFTRYEPPLTSPSNGRNRASTTPSTASVKSPKKSVSQREDVFDQKLEEEDEPASPDLGRSQTFPDKFDELPIELASLTDRFVESLGAKVFSEPPTIDHLAEIFQEFYLRASSSISIHISALLSRLNRETSPSRAKAGSKKSTDVQKASDKPGGAQQMLTASEVTEKRRARRLLEYKRILLEEAVERRACEKIYDKIWRHKSTLDEVRDEKLRSKTAALALVGIGLKDLGIEIGSKSSKTLEDVQESLAPARDVLAKMNEERYPLGKLQHLTTAHKAIVDTLSSIHSSSSSADEILPTLIYTLITSPVEGINIISNLYFIQRFRAANKIDGEAAYCMTNLEAAISFLENVDLASLRADEVPEGPSKSSSRPATPTVEKLEPFPNLPSTSVATTSTTASTADGTTTSNLKSSLEKPMALPTPRHQRTLSDLLYPLSNANEAVRSTAEEGFKNMSTTLDNSFKFFFGKLKERSADDDTLPRTLDDARLLVSRPLTPEDEVVISETSSIAEKDGEPHTSNLTKGEDKILSLIGGRKVIASAASNTNRDRSVDSAMSNGSGKRVAFAATGTPTTELPPGGTQKFFPSQPSSNPLDSVKNFGNSINPINHIGSALGGAFRGFGSRPVPAAQTASSTTSTTAADNKDPSTKEVKPQFIIRTPTSSEAARISAHPPLTRFLDVTDAAELKIGDVQALLRDYQRLADLLEGLRMKAEAQGQSDTERDKDKENAGQNQSKSDVESDHESG